MSVPLPIAEPGHWADAIPRQAEGSCRVLFVHQGELSRDELDRLIGVAEGHCLASLQSVATRKRLLNLLVEGLENVRCHTPADLADTAFAMLVFEQAGYRLFMGNAAPRIVVASMSHRIDILNDMDEADLREHHLKLLANEGRTERGGAGLGLLTMARKSTGPIITHAFPRDASTTFLALELVLAA
ncbi:MAG: hypothetical protein IT225_08475 [Flavobacteriales bacterium]|nr:hypothetical protein [Flavobacteriales bacterium]